MKIYTITDALPTPIVADFDTFLAGIDNKATYLTEGLQTLDRATLYALDAKMQTYRTQTHSRADQHYYPLLNLFQRICIAARLHTIQPSRGELRMIPTEFVQAFLLMSAAEKYVALLEALWVYVDWSTLGKCAESAPCFDDDAVIEFLSKLQVGKKSNRLSTGTFCLGFKDCPALHVLSFFGLLTCEKTSDPRKLKNLPKDIIFFESFMVSEFGHTLLNILAKERPRYLWNMPGRREFFSADFPGQKRQADKKGLTKPEPFYKALLPLFPAGAITQGLPQAEQKIAKGTFTFKISFGKDVWHTIAMSAKQTLEDLHLAIQKAFDFDNDHLFAFYMDGKRYSKNCYNDPRGESGPFADEALIGAIDLWLHRHILYLFDFGHSWYFDVELIKISDEPHKGKPKALEHKGKNPEQYAETDW